MTSQSKRYSSAGNPSLIPEVPLLNVRFGVWRAVCGVLCVACCVWRAVCG